MKDVAQVMGVWLMTVSNAFNRLDQLSSELRTRILARAEKMGHAGPSAAGRALRQGRSNSYGAVFADSLSSAFADPFTMEWLAGLAAELEAQHFSIVLMSVKADDLDGLARARNTNVDGIAAACHSLFFTRRWFDAQMNSAAPDAPVVPYRETTPALVGAAQLSRPRRCRCAPARSAVRSPGRAARPGSRPGRLGCRCRTRPPAGAGTRRWCRPSR